MANMKYALVTGGSRGLGKAVCLKVAKMGIPVLINYQSNEAAAQEVKALVEAEGVSAELLRFDVRVKQEVDEALSRWEEAHPDDYIAYLVNNAGIRRDGMMFMMPEQDWHDVLDITLNGFYNVTTHVLPKMMMRKHGGRIVNMSSLSGLKGLPGQTNYSAPQDELKKQIPVGRFGRPEEVAALAGFLLSDEAAYITGEVISINGGLYT